MALAAELDGWRGGLLLSALSAAAVFAFSPDQSITTRCLECLALLLLACFTAAAAGRERRLLHHYRKVADQLSGVYEKVQANFEGMKRVERLSAIGQLSAGLAHEIRNPLASISGAAAILARSQDLDQKNARCLEIITSECERLNGLLTNFLNFARPRPPRLQTIQLEPVLDNVLELASHGVRGKAVRFEKQVTSGLPPVECDPEQLEQVLLNLMINAIEASPDGGNHNVVGRGRREQDRDRRRGQRTRRGAGPYRSPVRPVFHHQRARHRTRVACRAPDRAADGRFPSSPGKCRSGNDVFGGPPVEGSKLMDSARILVVDDDDNLRWVLQTQLEQMGYAVIAAADGPRRSG